MLDLSVYKPKYLEIKISEETTLHIKKPSQQLVITFEAMTKSLDVDTVTLTESLKLASDMAVMILNNNIEDIKYTKKEVDKLFDYEIHVAIMTAFGEFINGILSNPN